MSTFYETKNYVTQETEEKPSKAAFAAGISILIFIIIWLIAGIVAFILSIVCFGRSGSTLEHIVGLLIAIFFGPFYFIYYAANRKYCKKLPASI